MREQGWTRDRAQAQVAKEHPALWDRHRHELVFPGRALETMTKAAPLTTEAVCQEAEALMKREDGLTKRAALARLAQQHPEERAYYDAYRQFHLSEGLAEGDTLGEAERRVEKRVYDLMWNLGRS